MKLEIRVVIRGLGLLLIVLSGVIALVALFAAFEHFTSDGPNQGDLTALLAATFVGAVLGGILFVAGRSAGVLGQREAFLLVAASWLLVAAIGALPYFIWAFQRPDAGKVPHDFDTYVNCYFEAMSGLTTTGATIVQKIGTLPRSLLLWRALTHWLGGLGIVVLFVAVLPMLGGGSRRVYRIEAAGPTPEGVKPRIQDTARVLWLIYTGLTLIEVLALKVCGMSWFDSTCHTFATLATGGFSTQDASMGAFPRSCQVVVIVFMVLAGVNFALYHELLQGRWRAFRKDPELRVYLSIILIATIIVTVSLILHPPARPAGVDPVPLGATVHDALFQVVSIQTTTGYCTTDFDTWGFVAKATLLTLMFIGGSAGSTGGGIKVMRIMIAVKVLWAEIEQAYRPKVVRPVKIGKTAIHPDLKLNTMVYLVGIAVLFCMGTAALMFLETNLDVTSAATASAATLNNIGPGLARVGATQNYAWFCDGSKIVMSILMLLGRLEVFTVVALFSPWFWREE